MARKEILDFFKDREPLTFAIEFKSRNNAKMVRDPIIKALADMVPAGHKVNLTSPDVTILVEVINLVCGFAIVQDYHKLKKYSLEEVIPMPPMPKKEKAVDTV
jgi:tRNA acetyltransferase TAN1